MPLNRHFRFVPALLVLVLVFTCMSASRSSAQGPEQFREVSGKVVDAHHQPAKGAVVHIENEASEEIQSYVTDADGYFHFKRVSSNDDFRVWASLNGAMSKKHQLSKFNSKETPFITLVLP